MPRATYVWECLPILIAPVNEFLSYKSGYCGPAHLELQSLVDLNKTFISFFPVGKNGQRQILFWLTPDDLTLTSSRPSYLLKGKLTLGKSYNFQD